jgi:hypothetical protein
MRIRALIFVPALLALALSPVPAAAQDAFLEAPRGEIGIRYWLSSGESKRSHDAQSASPTAGNPSTVLTYENLDANSFELLARLRLGQTLFLKGNAGIGGINTGQAVEQDFARGQLLVAESVVQVSGGRVGYFSVDAGREWIILGRGRTVLGPFIGFGYWREEVEAFSNDVKVVNTQTSWSALRIGLAADLLLGPSTRFALDLALVPYAEVREEDGPRDIVIEGRGAGVQIDAEVRYMWSPRTEVRVGARAWYLESTDGTRKAAGTSFPLVEMSSVRTGLTFSLLRVW